MSAGRTPPPGFFRAAAALVSCMVRNRPSEAGDAFAGKPVPLSLYKYIEEFFDDESSQGASISSLAKAFCYMDAALSANPTFFITESNVYRTTAAAIILATKGYNETGRTCAKLASLACVPPAGVIPMVDAMMGMLNCELWVDPKRLATYEDLLLAFTKVYTTLVLGPITHDEYTTIDGGEFRGLRQLCRDNFVMPTDVFHLCSLLPNADTFDDRLHSLLRKKLSISQPQYDALPSNVMSLITGFTVKLRASLPIQWAGVIHQWQQEERVTDRTLCQHADAIRVRCIELGYSPSFFAELVPGKVRALVDKDWCRHSVAVSLKRSIKIDITAVTKKCSTLRDAAVFLVQKLSPSRCPDELVSDLFTSSEGTSCGEAEAAVMNLFNTTTAASISDPDVTTRVAAAITAASNTRLIEVSELPSDHPLRVNAHG